MPNNTVLITAIGGDVAQGVAQIIREQRPGWRLIGADTHKEHGGSSTNSRPCRWQTQPTMRTTSTRWCDAIT